MQRLPFKINSSEILSDSGRESTVHKVFVKANTDGTQRQVVLKENRNIELADDAEMQNLKRIYEYLKNDPEFGKFVIQTDFVKAQKNEAEPARAYLVQKFVDGKRIDELSDEEIYGDKKLSAELLEFVKASIKMLQKAGDQRHLVPDFYADREKFLGNFLHNPRYSGNIWVTNSAADDGQRVWFVDTGTLMGPVNAKGILKKIKAPVDDFLQITQLKMWQKKLESQLK